MMDEACRGIPFDQRCVGDARAFAVRVLADWGLGDDFQYDAALLVSELVTNALLYGKPPVTLTLHRLGPQVRVEVADGDPSPPLPLEAGIGDEHGRGLQLVTILADRWGVDPGTGGKVVWLILGGGRAR